MSRILSFLTTLLFFTSPGLATEYSFVLQDLESGTPLQQEGPCDSQCSPCSTFKIPLSLMGYNEGVFQTETTPQWPYKEEYGENRSFMLEAWKGPQTPKTWIQYSCVWFSQVFTQLLGQDKFKDYLEEFNYGNQDASGDPGKNNGLTHCWLSSSLKISPLEQVAFLRKLLKKELPVSQEAHLLTQKILFLEELAPGWTLYGKTGSGDQEAWFVGWIKGPQNLVFSCCVQDKEKKGMVKSILAKDHAKALLLEFIQQNSL